ncbi:MAG: hypothetical protein ACJ0Q6_08600 [Candidatus Azotimanducaceae bacterium]|uniref:Uncharacterized protein n=1 Tax=OM182 bacterium TaxID=2510334 RepID=A0A520RYN6_9GAMM|nr:MAG: hypothetical protein EVA68_07300 [OM182 bacterium]
MSNHVAFSKSALEAYQFPDREKGVSIVSAAKLIGIFISLIVGIFCSEIILWQFFKFGSLLSIFVSIFIALAILVAMAWTDLRSKEEDPTGYEPIPNGALCLLPSLTGFYLFMLAPFWNASGYCSNQVKVYLDDNVFGESVNSPVLSDQSTCLRNSVDYMSLAEWIIIVPFTLLILAPFFFIFFKWLFGYIEENWERKESKTETPSVSSILDGLRQELETKTYRKNESEIFYFRFPEARMNECTEEEKKLVIKYYQALIKDLPNVYSKESERKTLVNRIKSITKKIDDAQEAINKLKTYQF